MSKSIKHKLKDDETLYVCRNGKYIPYGKIWEHNTLPYGSYFVDNKRSSRRIKLIKAIPDFTNLESAIYKLEDTICNKLCKKEGKWNRFISNYEYSQIIVEAIREEVVNQQKELIYILKNDNEYETSNI